MQEVLALYMRLSDEDDNMPKGAESNSISHQRQLMMEYVSGRPDLQGYRIAEFVDDGYSGADFTRPNFQKMMDMVKAGSIGVIITKDYSRLGRDYLEVVNHHLEVPYRVLEERYTYNAEQSGNMIIRGDNLEALKALLPRYEGRVKCIYIDPPYNTGNEGWVYNDNVNDPRIRKWLGEVVGREGEDLSRHDKWLCMMYPRLKLLQRLLVEDGVIFISIDDNEQANLKLICDEIFGASSFVSIISWQRTYSKRNDSKVWFMRYSIQ